MYDPVSMDCCKSGEKGSKVYLDIIRTHLAIEHLTNPLVNSLGEDNLYLLENLDAGSMVVQQRLDQDV